MGRVVAIVGLGVFAVALVALAAAFLDFAVRVLTSGASSALPLLLVAAVAGFSFASRKERA